MAGNPPKQEFDIGMIGLGVMGRNLLLNMADHGFSVAGYDTDLTKVEALRKEAESRRAGSSKIPNSRNGYTPRYPASDQEGKGESWCRICS